MLRREFLKLIGFTALSIGTGIGFAGCSGSGSSGGEFKPSNPVSTGYKLIYPDWTKPVPERVISHIIEAGKRAIDIRAPGDLTAYVICDGEKIEVPIYNV